MIFVTLGTQDKSFKRLLEQVEKEIKEGNIVGEVNVQAGYTSYESNLMNIFDYVDGDKFNEYIKKADYVISHAGVGTILTALENDKKVIVVPRLSEYLEHTNDHQVQIAEEFSREGYVIYLKDLKDLGKEILNLDKFVPRKLVHNNLIIETIEEYIDSL